MRFAYGGVLRGFPGRRFRFREGAAIPMQGRLRAVTFPSEDRIMLTGWYGEAAEPAATIILCHGMPGDKRDMAGLAGALVEAGFGTLAFDFRGWGESDRGPVTFGYREMHDILGAVTFVQNQRTERHQRIGIVGLSMGAAAAILAAAETPAIEAIVADSSYARLDQEADLVVRRLWGPLAALVSGSARQLAERLIGTPLASVSPVNAVAKISPRPVMIIHGMSDRLTDVRDAYALYQACGDPKTLWIIEHAAHARTRRVGAEQYDRRIIEFFRQHLAARRERRETPCSTSHRSRISGRPNPTGPSSR